MTTYTALCSQVPGEIGKSKCERTFSPKKPNIFTFNLFILSLFLFLVRLLRLCYHLAETNKQLVSIKQHQLNRGNDANSKLYMN